MDYIEANNKVTLKTLDINRTPDIIKSVFGRLTDVLVMSKKYMNTDMRILDMGTKDCLFFDVLVENGFDKNNLIGIECCPEVVDICNSKGYAVHEMDVQDIGFEAEPKFDFIFIIHTLEHVPNPEKVVDECKRLLKSDGFVFVEVPIQSKIDDPELWGHFHPFTSKQQVKDLFSEGFNVMDEDWQKTRSKSPWYRIIFQRGE